VPVLARTLEKAGLSTILVTNMPFWAEKIGVPRTLAVEFPFGHTLGQPKNVEQQMRVLQQAIQGFEEIEKPGVILHSPEVWPIPKDAAIKEWQPEEPSPVIQHISKNFRELMRKSRK
jgi:hypothetical protein